MTFPSLAPSYTLPPSLFLLSLSSASAPTLRLRTTANMSPILNPIFTQILDWALFGVSTFFVFFRLWIRVRRLWRLGLSDYFILSSWLAVGMVCAFNTILYVLQLNYAGEGMTRTMAMLLMPFKQVIISAKVSPRPLKGDREQSS